MVEYEERDATLRKLGYANYAEYLASSLWRKIRERVLTDNDRQCVVCGERAEHVHHTSYAKQVLTGQDISSLLPLCPTCHEIGEFDSCGRKRPLHRANDYLGYVRTFIPKQPPVETAKPRTKAFKVKHKVHRPEKARCITNKCQYDGCDGQAKTGCKYCRKHGRIMGATPEARACREKQDRQSLKRIRLRGPVVSLEPADPITTQERLSGVA